MAVDPRVYNERGEVVSGYLSPEEARNMGLEWKPRPNEPAPYRTEDEARAAGTAYVSEAEHYARVGGNYNYGSDAFRLEELKALVSGRLTTDQVVIPSVDSSIVRTLIDTMPQAQTALAPAPPAPPAPPASTPATTGTPAPPGVSTPMYPGAPGVNTGSAAYLGATSYPSAFAANGSGGSYLTTAAGQPSAPGSVFGLPTPVVLIAAAALGYYLLNR